MKYDNKEKKEAVVTSNPKDRFIDMGDSFVNAPLPTQQKTMTIEDWKRFLASRRGSAYKR